MQTTLRIFGEVGLIVKNESGSSTNKTVGGISHSIMVDSNHVQYIRIGLH